MKALLIKLLSLFRQPEPQKPVEPWPFPPVAKECCGGCDKPAKKTVKKAATPKPAAKKAATKPAKKTVKKKAK